MMRVFRNAALLLLVGLMAGCGSGDTVQTEKVQEVVYRPEPRAAVEGTLLAPGGTDGLGIIVYAQGTSFVSFTDPTGHFVLSGLPPGEYTLNAFRTDLAPAEIGTLEVREEDLTEEQPFFDLGSIMMREGEVQEGGTVLASVSQFGNLRGRVLTATPGEEQGVLVEVQGTDIRTVTDTAGSFFLYNLPVGSYTLAISKQSYTPVTRAVRVQSQSETVLPAVRLELENPMAGQRRAVVGTITLVDENEQLVTEYDSVLVALEGTSFITTPDASGRFVISGIDPGAYTVTANAAGYALDQKVEVDLTEIGAAEVDLVLRAGQEEALGTGALFGQAILEGAPAGANAGIIVSLVGADTIRTTDRTGSFLFEALPAGTYDLVAMMTGYESTMLEGITVVEGEETRAPTITLMGEVERPRVLATNPVDGQQEVPIEEPTIVTILFNQNMDPASLRQAISVEPEVTYSVALKGEHPLAEDDRAVVLLAGYVPEGPVLRYKTRYIVTVDETATNREGVAMEEPYAFAFTTAGARIVSTWPSDGQENVFIYIQDPIRIYFNARVNPRGYTPEDVSIWPTPLTNHEVQFISDPATGWSEMIVSVDLNYDVDYRVTIGGRLRTVSGDPIENMPYRLEFSTLEGVDASESDLLADEDEDLRVREEERRR